MGNPFYNQNQPTQNPNPMMNMVQQFQQFKANFQGDPRQRVQDLLNSGQMSQQQFNYLSNLAQQRLLRLHSSKHLLELIRRPRLRLQVDGGNKWKDFTLT